jgi:hypothetical protein
VLVLFKGARRRGEPFEEHEKVDFFEHSRTKDLVTGRAPKWDQGYVVKVENNCVYLRR